MIVTSPLTGTSDITLLEVISTERLIADWQHLFQIDITEELHHLKYMDLYLCHHTKLKFFMPLTLAGSEQLYKQLERFDWYYMPQKWEHDVAMKDIEMCQKILEIGCGRGDFINRLCQIGRNALGLELNSCAVNDAKNKKIPVIQEDIYKFADQHAEAFDAVCAFQVLEHIPDLRRFLFSLIKLVKPHGKIILAVPNANAFPKYSPHNILDFPPHHMTQWTLETFQNLNKIFPLHLKRYRFEPLAQYHVAWYVSIQLARFLKNSTLPLYAINRRITFLLKRFCFLRSFITGHTLYVCFEKHGSI